jgi:hypothetical protein
MDTKIFLKSTSSVTVPFPWEGLSGKGFTINYVYNPLTLAYEVQQPSSGGGGGGDASAANQVTGNASLSSIDGKILSDKVSTSACTNVSSSATVVTLLSSTAGRRSGFFFNDSTSDVYLKLGTSASATSFTVKIASYGYYELPQPIYTGAITGIWVSANGSMRITELT